MPAISYLNLQACISFCFRQRISVFALFASTCSCSHSEFRGCVMRHQRLDSQNLFSTALFMAVYTVFSSQVIPLLLQVPMAAENHSQQLLIWGRICSWQYMQPPPHYIGAEKWARTSSLHKLFEHPQGSRTSQQNSQTSRELSSFSLGFEGRERTFEGGNELFDPPPPSHPVISGPEKDSLCALVSCLHKLAPRGWREKWHL